MTCFHPSSCLLLIYLTPGGCAQVMYRVFMLFQGKGLFSQIWALSCEDRQTYGGLLFQGKRQPHITLSYDSRGRRKGEHHPRLSRRYAPLTLQQMFRCGRPAAIHFLRSTERAAECTSEEEEQRREVEQHPTLCKWKQRGLASKRQPRTKARVRIMTNLHLNNSRF